MGISAAIITYNEEANIERCLRSLSFVDEIIVVDSFSTDRTVEIARHYTDKVVEREFKGDSDQRNAALGFASNDWVVAVDADEVVTTELAEEIQRVVEASEFQAYRMPRITHFLGKPIRHCGWYPDHVIKLMRKSKARHPDRLIHADVEVDGLVGTLENHLIHYSYNNVDDIFRKTINFSRQAAKQKYMDGRRCKFSDLTIRPGLTFLKKYFIKQGFRDGVRGFLISMLAQFGVFFRYVILWEMSLAEKATETDISAAATDLPVEAIGENSGCETRLADKF